MPKYYEPESFDEYYKSFLTEKVSGRYYEYIDPDVVGDVGKMSFYIDMTDFLNSREKKLEKKLKNEYFFLPPLEAPGTEDWLNENKERVENHKEWWTKHKESFKKDEKWIKKYGALQEKYEIVGLMDEKKITVVQNGEKIFRLTSDQFGFSAAESIYDNDQDTRYPLVKLLYLCKEKSEDEQKKVIAWITEYVKNTRTIGGSFLWPILPEGSRKCEYNNQRGVNNYLEDRVDLTLLEVKHALEKKYDHDECKSDILCSQYENEHMKKWLAHFGSFEEYVKYFMLEPFCKKNIKEDKKEGEKDRKDYDYVPINIIDGEPIDEKKIEEYSSKRGEKYKAVQKLKIKEDIINMLDRLEGMILIRTANMERAIRLYRQEKGSRDSTQNIKN